jgi:transcription elongation factor GreA
MKPGITACQNLWLATQSIRERTGLPLGNTSRTIKQEKRTQLSADIKIKLQSELDELESELRVHLPKEIKRALEFGDLRENSEYRAALDRQNVVKARIVELRQRISEISSIDLSKISQDKAGYGSTLILFDGERDEEVTYRLVTPEESDPQQGLISTTSPVGKSLMGKEEGDEVVVRTPAGARNFEIRRLTTIHDEMKNKPGKP